MGKIWTSERVELIKANKKMDYRELAKILQVTPLQLLDQIVRMKRNLEI